MNPMDRPIEERLLNGARTLGQFWRNNERCVTQGWSVKRAEGASGVFIPEPCTCNPTTRFCRAKIQWLTLAGTQEDREMVEGDHGLALSMWGREWDATGLTLSWDYLGMGVVRVGPKGGVDMTGLRKLGADPVSGCVTLKLMARFSGSKIAFEEVVKAPEEPAVAAGSA